MPNTFDYQSNSHHVEKRSELSEQLQTQLQEMQTLTGKRDAWAKHARFAGEAEFWLQVHRALLGASAQLPQRCASFMLVLDDSAERKKQLTKLSQLGGQLIHHAHTHHHVEDHHFFPVFEKTFPTLKYHMELLDGDHKVLTEALDQLESAVRNIPAIKDDANKKDIQLLTDKAEILFHCAKKLDALFTRHIHDEEEICIPALLQL